MGHYPRKHRVYTFADYLDFGQYNGQTLESVAAKDPRYIVWALENISWFDMRKDEEQVVLLALQQNEDDE